MALLAGDSKEAPNAGPIPRELLAQALQPGAPALISAFLLGKGDKTKYGIQVVLVPEES